MAGQLQGFEEEQDHDQYSPHLENPLFSRLLVDFLPGAQRSGWVRAI
jgi:hypothetical protein